MQRSLFVVCAAAVTFATPVHAQFSRTVGVQVAFPSSELERGAETGLSLIHI